MTKKKKYRTHCFITRSFRLNTSCEDGTHYTSITWYSMTPSQHFHLQSLLGDIQDVSRFHPLEHTCRYIFFLSLVIFFDQFPKVKSRVRRTGAFETSATYCQTSFQKRHTHIQIMCCTHNLSAHLHLAVPCTLFFFFFFFLRAAQTVGCFSYWILHSECAPSTCFRNA